MALRPYWQKHPVQLRLAAIVALAGFPLIILWIALYAAWEGRGDVKKFFKDCWSLIWRGQI